MKLSGFSIICQIADAVIHPWKQESSNKRSLAWAITIILGVLTLGGAQLISWVILKATKGPVDHHQSSRIEQISAPILAIPIKKSEIQLKISSLPTEALDAPNETRAEENQNQSVIMEIKEIHKTLLDGPQNQYNGWLSERVYSWKIDRKLLWSTDYLNHTKNYLLQLLALANKPEKEREAMFERGIAVRYILLDNVGLKRHELKPSVMNELEAILTREMWYRDAIQEANHLILVSQLDSSKNAIPLLLEAGIDPNDRDENGNTPLHWSVANASLESASVLIQHAARYKIDFDAQDWGYSCRTPLQLAISKGRRKEGWDNLVTDLIAHTRDLNKKDKDGNTALHLACVRRDKPYIQALLKAGANANIQNLDGKTPEDLWAVSSDEAWKILRGSHDTTTFDKNERDSLGLVFKL